MIRKRTIILSLSLFTLLFLMNSMTSLRATPPPLRISAATKVATITVTGGSGGLVANTPIIIDESEFSAYSISLATAIVKDGTTELNTQYDSELGELVFQIPNAIAASGTKTFDLYAEATGSTNGQSTTIEVGQGNYSETYDAWLPSSLTDNGWMIDSENVSPNVAAVGNVVWVETDWVILCFQLQAQWRQGSLKHIYMKDEGWDLQMASFNASQDRQFTWSGWPSDHNFGWEKEYDNGYGLDTATIVKAGPVRAVVRTVSSTGWRSPWGAPYYNLNQTLTWFVYNDYTGWAQHFELTSDNATLLNQAFTDFTIFNYGEPMEWQHKLRDQGFQGGDFNLSPGWPHNFTHLYTPGQPIGYRGYGMTKSDFNASKLTESYLGMYNTSNYGYMYHWGTPVENVTQINWSGEEVAIHSKLYAFPEEGLMRYCVPFSGVSGNATEYIDAANDRWTATYTVAIAEFVPETTTTTSEETTESTSEGGPGFEFITTILVIATVSVIFYRKRK